ncbi:Fic family protein [Candidatus Pacearchaeota archaeon]|nr:Fic family protein [Candidatus Pacearchaeota archaeon]
MVEIKEIIRGKKKYYYLSHSYRKGKSVKKKETYLGETIPKDLEKIKKKFMREFYSERFLKDINKIRDNFNSEYKRMPRLAREKEKKTFAIKFTYNTQRIEGSTLTLRETENLIDKGITPSKKSIVDVKEAEAHRDLFFEMFDYEKDLSLSAVLFWHKKLLENTKKEIAGKTRNHGVRISMSKFIPPLHIELDTLLHEFFKWYSSNKNKIHPVELAALVHLKFVTIHPFSDGNGRISRIMMNFVLKKYKFPMFDIPYEKRDSYYTALERSQVKKEDHIFVQWFFKRYIKEYETYLKS